MSAIDEILIWFEALPASFAFLLALPFVIAFVVLLKDAIERRCEAPPRPARRHGRLGHP